jgi:small-conductance mechanosensitive channel
LTDNFFNYASAILEEHALLKSFLLSVVLFFLYLVIKRVLIRSVSKKTLSTQEQLLLKKRISQYLFYFFVLSVFFIWFAKLQVFFVSIFAIAAAIVVALKELIMCVTGGILVRTSNIFNLGHRIEIAGVRGFVIEKTLLTTKILEIGPEKNSQQTTGDVITLPNSLMLAKEIKNESYFKGYSIKSFIFKIDNELLIYEVEKKLLEIVLKSTAPYLEEAKQNIGKFCESEGLIVPNLEPKTKIILEGGKDFSILVKFPIINSEIANIEQELNRYFLNWKLAHKEKKV